MGLPGRERNSGKDGPMEWRKDKEPHSRTQINRNGADCEQA